MTGLERGELATSQLVERRKGNRTCIRYSPDRNPAIQHRCRWALLGLMLLATCGLNVPLQAREGPAFGQNGEDRSAENFSKSGRLRRDRQREARLVAARRAVQRQEYAEAIGTLQNLLDGAADPFVADETGSGYRSLKDEANRLIASLPEAERRLYEQQVGAAARGALQGARSAGDLDALIEVSLRYRNTRAGFEALQQLAALYFDRGQYQAADSALEAVHAHPLAEESDRKLAWAKLIVARARSGDFHRAEDQLAAHRDRLDVVVELAGRSQNLSEWLEGELRRLKQEAPREIEGDASRRVASGDPSDFPPRLPALQPVWTHSTGLSDSVRRVLDDELENLREVGVVPLSSLTSLVGNRVVVSRTLDQLVALDLESGETLWQKSFALPAIRAADLSQTPLNLSMREMVSEALIRQFQADSVYGRLTTDGTRLFVIVDEEKEQTRSPSRRRGRRRNRERTAADSQLIESENQLAALDLKTGELVWTQQEASDLESEEPGSPDAGGDFALSDVSFFGPPRALSDTLYGVGQVNEEIRLFALAAETGRLRWSLSLADVTEDSDEALRRQRLACPVVYRGGLLLCPTASGVVVGVDLSTRRCRWAYRYELDEFQPEIYQPAGPAQRRTVDRWWHGWREVSLFADANVLLFASPESDSLHALDPSTGRFLWKQPRREGLFVAGTFESQAIVVEKSGIRSLDLETGTTTWTADVGLPAGRGFLADAHYYFSTEDGRLMAVRLTDGAARGNSIAMGEKPGHLIASTAGVLMQQIDGVRLLPLLDRSRADVARRLDDQPDDLALVWERTLLAWEAGDFATARSGFQTLVEAEFSLPKTFHAHLGRMHDDFASTELPDPIDLQTAFRTALFAELRAHPDRLPEVRDELASLSRTKHEQAADVHLMAQTEARNGQRLEALDGYFQLFAAKPEGDQTIPRGLKRVVRIDRHLQGEIADLFEDADADEAERLGAHLLQRLDEAAEGGDPFAVQRFANWLSQLRWGRLATARFPDEVGLGVPRRQTELRLLELAGSTDPQIAGPALLQLARLMQNRSYRTDAAHYYQRLEEEFADVPLDDRQTGAEIVAAVDNPLLQSEIESGPSDYWPRKSPRISTEDHQLSDVYWLSPPIEADRGTLFDRLDVTVDRHGKKVRIAGDGHRGYWETELPESRSPFRYVYSLHRGWGIGHLLLLQVGTELFCIAPFDANGEPEAELLWSIDTIDGRAPNFNQLIDRHLPDRLGFHIDEYLLLGEFGQGIAQIGPVRPGYVCYQQRGKLVAVETATGERLWQRYDLPDSSFAVGDDEFVFLLQWGSNRLEVLRAIDGGTVAVRNLEHSSADFLVYQGRYALREAADANRYQLCRVNLLDGETVWNRTFPADSVPFAIDRETVGLIEPGGTLHILWQRTGATQATHEIERPEELTTLVCARDPHRFYLALSGPVAQQEMLEVNQVHGGYRNPIINGPLYAYNRRTGELEWKTVLDHSCFAIDQPRQTPFLVLAYRQPSQAFEGDERQQPDSRRPVGVYELIDKRTGETIWENIASQTNIYYVLETHPEEGWADLKTPKQSIRFDFLEQSNNGRKNEEQPSDDTADSAADADPG